ncbi:peptide chain release factor N(5)-glutamine methyltransferase [cyanobacterium endosymbiont of Epithemia clementina EcSB]|uniref:peptide chain release factor N(5)-glutamine methyltransferase n=1 Tax=cyanobacterium endosymbiont of Epithemia clementina EcSB TaxID=3034674 RepID=UPI002480C2CF|nr:peptide chain release factor N(5)-glutamine methyltransferase [cyanobacterium endosymbiont of Epithemia clementina EcSB]WGT67600.1 peptide chain release factor N(5)-glutamine methyltransferase [cyanobacterium endosymbiont of Epithemia clementina EcSB]
MESSTEESQKTVISGSDLATWRNWAITESIAANISPQEVDWLLQEVAELDRLSLRLESFRERSQIYLKFSLSHLDQLWQHRLKDRVPIQYLVGVTPWRNFLLKVAPGVLIPRPETELIIDFAVQAVQKSSVSNLKSGHWVDLGTGSGAISVGLGMVFPLAKIHAVDKSKVALTIAKENAKNLGLSSKIQFYEGSWWTPLEELKGQISGLVSNPPYIPTRILPQLQPEVRYHEPYLALDGGKDGLEAIRYLVHSAPKYLQSGGIWLIEMMAGQGERVAQLLENSSNYRSIKILSDLAGIQRFVLAYRT